MLYQESTDNHDLSVTDAIYYFLILAEGTLFEHLIRVWHGRRDLPYNYYASVTVSNKYKHYLSSS